MKMLDAAFAYADLGYRVFPCAPGRKQPLTAHGFLNATVDLDQIDAWWTQYPDANVAIATEGLVVIDVDGTENPWLVDQPERARELATGVVSITPNGGRHYIFREPEGKSYRCQTGTLALRVDVRAEGGYVLLPPSMVGNKAYHFVVGLALDQPRERLPEPPGWLITELDKLATSSPTSPRVAPSGGEANKIPSGQRNATLARLAGTMRRVGMSQPEIAAAIQRVNADRCAPPLPPPEVERIATSVSRYAPDQISVAVAEDHWQQMCPPGGPNKLKFSAITSQELAENEYQLSYLIDGILVRGQPGVIAGPKKTLKTNISIDLALALSSAGLFLGHFNVPKPVRVGVMSGESGAATIQETAKRIAEAKAADLESFANAFWAFEVPQLGNAMHTAALREFISSYQLDVLILDPTYLMMLALGDNAGNLFIVGSFLKSLGDLAQETGCTPILCHHLKKGVADPYEPAELENIAWAGFQEFVRQWILLNRRVRYDPGNGGHHELWMSVGGSAGHSGLWGLNIDEGTRQEDGGRRWEVEVIAAGEAYEERTATEEEAIERRKQQKVDLKAQRQREAVLNALSEFPDGETSRVIRESAGIGARSIQAVLDELIEAGEVVPCTVQKNKRREPAYRLATAGGPGGP